MPKAERNLVRDGAGLMMLFTGGVAYLNYRQRIKKEFLRSEAHYRFNHVTSNVTPWKQLYFTWWRMPEIEYNVYHRFKPYYILGQLDVTKEILIPKQKDGVDGYDVINPLYCYEGGKTNLKALVSGSGDSVDVERAAIIVNRGWIPANLKDKRNRPYDVNSRKLVKLRGVFRAGKDVHDYKVPNNPDSNEWNNLCLEDIGIFWELPNFDEQKYYYFQQVDFKNEGPDVNGIHAIKPDGLVDDHYGWRWNEKTNQLVERGFGAAALCFGALTYFAL